MKEEIRKRILLDIMGDLKKSEIRSLYLYMIYYCLRKKVNGYLRFEIDYNTILNKLSSYNINNIEYLSGEYFSVEPLFGNILDDINLIKINKEKLKAIYTIDEDGIIFDLQYI